MEKTKDIKDFVLRKLEALKGVSGAELDLRIADLIDELISSRVSIKQKVSANYNNSPIPDYDPLKDGDYSSWLALHNVD